MGGRGSSIGSGAGAAAVSTPAVDIANLHRSSKIIDAEDNITQVTPADARSEGIISNFITMHSPGEIKVEMVRVPGGYYVSQVRWTNQINGERSAFSLSSLLGNPSAMAQMLNDMERSARKVRK